MIADDIQLIKRVAEGDKSAFQTLYETTYPKVAHYINKMVNSKTMAEDILIQTYTAAWQKADTFKGGGRATTWLIGIARNTAFKEFSKNKRYTPFEESYLGADEKSYKTPESNDRKQVLTQIIDTLSPIHKEILHLVFFQDLSYPEISEIINKPVNTIKTRVFHAKKALKDAMHSRGITENEL